MALQPVPLISGAYQARSVLAGAQRALNLYPEQSPKDAPFPFVHYPTPGLRLLATTALGAWRMLYMASSGDLYGVVGSTVVWIDADNGWIIHPIGTITAGRSTPCSMTDNNNMGLLVDGTPIGGWYIDLATRVMTQVNPADNSSSTGGYGFVGADRVQAIDTYIVLNAPGTQQFYSTDPGTIAFDPFWFGAKSGYNDNLMTIAVTRREVWLIGRVTTEIWFDAGETSSGGIALFPFQIMPGPFVEHGTPAKYSVATIAGVVFFLGRSNVGEPGAYVGERYEVRNISTHAMEYEWSTYGDVSDAIGFCYEQQGHGFYVLTFPSADKTWVYDMATQLWHERGWADAEGQPHRHRAQVHAFARTTNVVGDWENGNLYALDPTVYTDDGAPIVRIRSWPRLNIGSKRVMYRQFVADMEVGTAGATTSYPPPPRVVADASLACRGIPSDPLKVALVDGAIAMAEVPLPPLPGDGTVTTDSTLTGSGVAAAPLSIIWVDGAVPRQGGPNGTLPWVATDDTLAGDGSPGAPLSVDLVDGRRQITCSATLINEPVVRLRWSDDKGQSWSNPVSQPFGSAGEYRASVQWQRLGMARDRVFELAWSAPVRTALSGAWVDSKEGAS